MSVKNKKFIFKKTAKYEKPKILRKFKEGELMPEKMEVMGAPAPLTVSTLAYFD